MFVGGVQKSALTVSTPGRRKRALSTNRGLRAASRREQLSKLRPQRAQPKKAVDDRTGHDVDGRLSNDGTDGGAGASRVYPDRPFITAARSKRR
jgi:hypothetical protein